METGPDEATTPPSKTSKEQVKMLIRGRFSVDRVAWITKLRMTRRSLRGNGEELWSMGQEDEPTGEMVVYQSQDGTTRGECRFADETRWLSQSLIAELFQTTPQNVTQHLRSIFREGELNPEATCKDFLQVRQEGERKVRRQVKHYNLDAILAVGYRVRSLRGTLFRTWATQRLSEYLVKGFTMDDERLKSPPVDSEGVPDYFDELLERIRDIRASERRMYLRVREIFALAASSRKSRPVLGAIFGHLRMTHTGPRRMTSGLQLFC
jgi:hypothetical protein